MLNCLLSVLIFLNCASNYLFLGEGDLLPLLLRTAHSYKTCFLLLSVFLVLQIRVQNWSTDQNCSSVFLLVFHFRSLPFSLLSLPCSNWFSSSPYFPLSFFSLLIFLAEIERNQNCGLICGNAAIYRIHLASYASRTIKSVILPESMS